MIRRYLLIVACVGLPGFGCAADSTVERGPSKEVDRSSSEQEEQAGPLSWLHRYDSHEDFEPAWEDIEKDSLEGRRLVIRVSEVWSYSSSETVVIADDDQTRCRRFESHINRFDVRGLIMFEPGSAKPVAYTGAGVCATENPPLTEAVDFRFRCQYNPGASVELHGLAWPEERGSEREARALSRKRVAVVERVIEETALPNKIEETRARGIERTHAPLPEGSTAPGVYIAIDNPRVADADTIFDMRDYAGPRMSDKKLATLRSFIEKRAEPPSSLPLRPSRWLTVSYRTEGGGEKEYNADLIKQEVPAMKAVAEWANALVDEECDLSQVTSPAEYYDK